MKKNNINGYQNERANKKWAIFVKITGKNTSGWGKPSTTHNFQSITISLGEHNGKQLVSGGHEKRKLKYIYIVVNLSIASVIWVGVSQNICKRVNG